MKHLKQINGLFVHYPSRNSCLQVSKKGEKISIIGNLCEICKKEPHAHIHHINQDEFDNDLSNILLVCKLCHENIHRNLPSKPYRLMSYYVIGQHMYIVPKQRTPRMPIVGYIYA
jgi:hypothetical protein